MCNRPQFNANPHFAHVLLINYRKIIDLILTKKNIYTYAIHGIDENELLQNSMVLDNTLAHHT